MTDEKVDRADEKADDVEAHGFQSADGHEGHDAKDEGPDVEGHNFDTVENID
ncbi:MAG: hypothetical protein H0V79_02115 [Actinobacteria bacterium]|nr:hypothetical protein [Actinomycetota bacterium]